MLLAVYWFNPLCWVAYILLCRDIEAACDEKVIRDKDRDYVVSYSQALLDCSSRRRVVAACPLAFGETGVKDRIKGVLNYKKPAFWVIIVAIIACIVVVVCFMTNPKNIQDNTLNPIGDNVTVNPIEDNITVNPIGDNVTEPIMLMAPAYAPYLQVVRSQ